MTYIKWKDEVEGYLISLPQDERDKILSYFSEMYADKRDAGKSEEQIIAEFGAPYDAAKRILDGTRDSGVSANGAQTQGGAGVSYKAPPQTGATQGGAAYGGGKQDYNYGAGGPAGNAQNPEKGTGAYGAPPPSPEKKKDGGRVAVTVILTIFLVIFTVSLVSVGVGIIVDGCTSVATAIGALAAGKYGSGECLTIFGYGVIVAAAGIILFAPINVLLNFLWRKLKEYKNEGKDK